ncbi:hypothetical protein HDU93_005600, partial [Gonapodya sp. JEL0774]
MAQDRMLPPRAFMEAISQNSPGTPSMEFRSRIMVDTGSLMSVGSSSMSAISPAYVALGGDPKSEDGVAINSTLRAT